MAIPGIQLIRSKRRTLSLEINAGLEVRVRAPRWLSENEIRKFIQSRQRWIEQSQLKIRRQQASLESYGLRPQESGSLHEAADILETRLKTLALAGGFSYSRFRLGNARTRWGSCSQRGNITLHERLVLVPGWVRDYVITHELCHLRHLNHSRLFWQEVGRLFPDYRRACAWLREHAGLLTLDLCESL